MHHPQAVVTEYRVDCGCRKPKPGLLTLAASEMGLVLAGSYMVGDQPTDMIAGKAVGCTTLLVNRAGPQTSKCDADLVCRDLAAAAQLIAEFEAGPSGHLLETT
jgi:D-glycero-D-manno-heptose 1,7-bisphosphate phosphatase